MEISVSTKLLHQEIKGDYGNFRCVLILKSNLPLLKIKKNFSVDTGPKLSVYIRRSEDVLDVFWTSYVRSIYVLCLRGFMVSFLTPKLHSMNTLTIFSKRCVKSLTLNQKFHHTWVFRNKCSNRSFATSQFEYCTA